MMEKSSAAQLLFIAGAPKAGTSSLFRWLADHPEAIGSIEKETYFFVDPGTHMYRPKHNVLNGKEGFASLFPACESNKKIFIESTPACLYYQTALTHMPSFMGRPRFIFVLREPSEQLYSLYLYFRNNWNWIPRGMSFPDYLAAAERGSNGFRGNELARHALANARYVDFLRRWRDRVGADRMLVATFDELNADQVAFTKRAAAFAGLDGDFYDTYDFPRDNETYGVRSAALQRANIALRRFMPRGRLYVGLRSTYRRLNTTRPAGPTRADAMTMADLKIRFAAANAELAEEFGLDLANWPTGG